jgi:anti-anti-sigma regulatory factor
MTHKSSHVPQETYHRIYWFARRNVDPRIIAHTLKLPLKTVDHIIERFLSSDHAKAAEHSATVPMHTKRIENGHAPVSDEDFLDMFLFVKTRYAVMDISGMVTKKNIHKLTTELHQLTLSELKAVAICLTDVSQLDEDGLGALIAFHSEFKALGRFTAILDPSPVVDAVILKHGAEKKIPVFGTESAFESHAFR